jgi:insulysin
MVGHMSDPAETPGLAHFLEHMLFLGTTSYPEDNSYKKWLNDHGGSSNASTSMERTNYFFDVAAPHLESTLDRFSSFFIEPLFSQDCTDKELSAVDNENAKNVLNDNRRLLQLAKHTCNRCIGFNRRISIL